MAEAPLEMSQLKTADKFAFNPPLLVRELMKSKIAEHSAKMKLREHLILESKLRQQLTQQLKQEVQNDSMLEVVNQLIY